MSCSRLYLLGYRHFYLYFRLKFRSFGAKKCLDVAHIGIAGEQALTKGQVSRHICHMHDQYKVWPGRCAVTLLYGGLFSDALLKGRQMLVALPV